MSTLPRRGLRLLAGLLLATAAHAAFALSQPFTATYDGTSQVVEVVDPNGPVLRFETASTGSGSFGLSGYFSTDVIDMSTGAGTGNNRFVAGNGDELFGSFSVQVIPTAVPNIVDLVGQAQFTGGTGLFSGASGNAGFTGTGIFTSQTTALSSLSFNGSIALVPEPGSWALMTAGVLLLVLRRWRRVNALDWRGESAQTAGA